MESITGISEMGMETYVLAFHSMIREAADVAVIIFCWLFFFAGD